jgi:hypothetical protein
VIVVDSSVWIDLLNGVRTAEVGRLLGYMGEEPLLVGDLILLEVLQGIDSDREADRVERALRWFDVQPMLGDDLAVEAARHYRRLRRRGVTVRKTVDLVIATFCSAYGHALLTSDRDFAPFANHAGLRLV